MDKKKIALTVFSLSAFLFGCASSKEADVPFKYGVIIQKAFGELGDGREIPVTIEKATEIDGSVTADGQYLFFSSDRDRGNFDIYLRSMTDITTVRLTSHPSKDTSPAVSPDGKYLAFVSTREDPQGDIYVMRVKPKEMVEDFASDPLKSYDDKASNITAMTDQLSRAPLSVKDSDPCWAPDGKSVVFSSSRGGDKDNLWICSRKGKDVRQLTTKGGIHPRFSQDGSLVVFVSYRENLQGDIYTVNVASGKETRITSTPGLKIYPSLTSDNNDVIFTMIDRDTNGDGVINFTDMSVLNRYNTVKKSQYPLTLYSSSSFRGRWFPAFAQKYINTQDDNFKGVIFYSSQTGENININVIPEYGIIPKRKSAADQLSLAESYLRDEGDREKYLIALLRVYYYFGDKADADSEISISRAVYRAADEFRSMRDTARVKEARAILTALSKKNNSYAAITGEALDLLLAGKDPYAAYEPVVSGEGKNRPDFAYLLDDAAQICMARAGNAKAAELYTRIVKEFPTYRKMSLVNYALARLSGSEQSGTVSPYYFEVIKKAEPYLRDKAVVEIVSILSREKDLSKRIAAAERMYPAAVKEKASKEENAVSAIADYVIGSAYAEKGNSALSMEYLSRALGKLRTSEVLFYDTNVLLSSIAAKSGNSVDEEKYLYNAALIYLNRWNKPGYTDTVLKLISYYENFGAELESAGDNKKAAELYQRYVKLVTYLHWLKKYESLYSEYGARAHVLYIDAASSSGKDYPEDLKKIEDQYSSDKLDLARLNFDKAHIYGLAWIYAKEGIEYDRISRGFSLDVTERSIAGVFRKSLDQLDWALFMDDTFCDPYLLQGWINQYVDLHRDELKAKNSFRDLDAYDDLFPSHLWEQNLLVYQKGLDVNNEVKYPDKEGSLHMNLANTQFLIRNYPAAYEQYTLASKYKKNFGSKKEEALFRYHFGYCQWQNGDLPGAKREMQRVLDIYNAAGGNRREAAEQRCILYRYLALFERSDKNYGKALSWYAKLLDESSRYKVKTDISRTCIDMAYCFEQSGDDVRALSYLAKAGDILKKADDNDPAYKVQFRLFGLLSFQFFDLGPDAMVIGDSRIPGVLSVAQKKLLVESSLERIAVKRGEYAKARVHIGRRLAILKGRSTSADIEMNIRALNSDGYCLFMLGKYGEAKERFEKALSIASDSSVNNSKSMAPSIENLVELYAFSCENGIPLLKNHIADLDALKGRIAKFRADYEKNRFESQKKSIEAVAESKNLKVSPAELEEAMKAVALDAAAVYAETDISAAILDFYSAEFRSVIMPPADPTGAYRAQDLLFKVYADSAELFENGAAGAALSLTRKAKLLLNAAVCREKTGMYEKAYELFGRAEQAAISSSRDDILFTVYRREALFLRDSGSSVDEGYLRSSARYFENACSIIEKAPALYASQSSAVSSLYRDYAILTARRNDYKGALRILERGYAVERVLSVSLAAPSFSRADFAADFSKCQDLLSSVSNAAKTRSDLVVSGKKEEALTAKAETNYAAALSALSSYGNDLDKRNPLLASYCFVRTDLPSSKDLAGSSVSVFLADGDSCYAWRITSSGTSVRTINGKNGVFFPGVSDFLKEDGKNPRRFVVLNDTAERIFTASREGVPPFTFIPSAERVRFFTSEEPAGFGTVASAGSPSDKGFLSADILSGNAADVSQLLFSEKASPSVAAVSASDSVEMRSTLEAMLLSGCRSALFFKGANPVTKKDDLQALGPDSASVNRSGLCFASGAAVAFARGEDAVAAIRTQLRGKSAAMLSKGDAVSALSSYHKYLSMSGTSGAADSFLLAGINDLMGDYASAAKNAALSVSDGSAEHLSWAVYLALKNGDCTSAQSLISASAGTFTVSPDYALYRAILAQVRGEDQAMIIPEGKTIVPRDKLSLLLFRYAAITGVHSGPAAIVSVSSSDDYCAAALSGAASDRISDPRAARISEFLSDRLRRNYDDALLLSVSSGEYDRLSVYPILGVLRDDADAGLADNSEFLREIKPEACSAAASRPDRILFLSACSDAFLKAGMADEQREVLALLGKELADAGMPGVRVPVLLDRAESLASAGNHKEAYAILKTIDPLLVKKGKVSSRYQLLSAECEIFLKDQKNGVARLNLFNPSGAAESAAKAILLAHSERLLVVETPAYAGEGLPKYEANMKKAVSFLDPSLFIKGSVLRPDLIDRGLDFMISFCTRKGDVRTAILYNEIKLQTELWTQSAGMSHDPLSKDAVDAYSSASSSQSFASALVKYPSLAFERRILFSPLEAFQKKIPLDSAAVVIVKNENDLFAWVIGRESIQPVRIAGGYKKVMELTAKYESALRDMGPVSVVSSALDDIFEPVFKKIMSKKIFIVTDKFTAPIPFEVLGEGRMLGKTGRLFYLASLSSSLGDYARPAAVCSVIGDSALDLAAVRESGITRGDKVRGIVHFACDISAGRNGMIAQNKPVASAVKDKSLVWIGGSIPFESRPAFVMELLRSGSGSVLVNDSSERGVNGQYFISLLYERIAAGDSLDAAFSSALRRLSESQSWAHPACWAGMRLYPRGIAEQ
jgi:TolB protein